MMNVLESNPISNVIIPYGKHSPFHTPIITTKYSIIKHIGFPVIKNPLYIQVIVVIECRQWYYVQLATCHIHQSKSQFGHFKGIGITIVPNVQ